MRKCIFLIFYLFGSISVSGQSKPMELREYYEDLYKTQNYIVNNKFDSACLGYNNMLSNYKERMNVIDVYNALLLNLTQKNKRKANDCLNILSGRNILISKLLTIRAVDSLVKLSPNIFKPKRILKLDNSYVEAVQHHLLDSVYAVDQNVRIDKNNYLTEEGKRRIHLTDSINANFLINYIQRYGFDDYEDVLHDTSKNLSKLEIMVLHQASQKNKEFIKLIKEGINSLTVKPGIGYYLIDLFNGSSLHETIALLEIEVINDDNGCAKKYSGKRFYFEYPYAIEQRIDSIRVKDLLEDRMSYINKVQYSLNNTLFNWHMPFSFSKMSFNTCTDFLSLVNNPRVKLREVE